MKKTIIEKINTLETQYKNGLQQLKDHEAACEEIRSRLLQIEGAVAALKDLVNTDQEDLD